MSLLSDIDSSVELLSEAIITLGSFAHGVCVCVRACVCVMCMCVCLYVGTAENLQAVVAAGTLPLLSKGTTDLNIGAQ